MANARLESLPESGDAPISSIRSSSHNCSGCGQDVDPLRARHVAVFEGRFRYFCRPECKHLYLQAQGCALPESVPTVVPPPVSGGNGVTRTRAEAAALIYDGPPADSDCPDAEAPESVPGFARSTVRSPAQEEAAPRGLRWSGLRGKDAFATLDAMGIVVGVLVPAIGLLGPTADAARVPLVILSWLALLSRVARLGPHPADPHRLLVIGPTAGAVAAACWSSIGHDPHAAELAVFAALSCAVAIAVEILVGRARRRVEAAREHIERALDVRVRAVQDDVRVDLPASEVRPGEQIIVEAGELVGVDATVTAGEARVVPWLGATAELSRREGDPVLAGARVLSSGLRMTATWSGRDRAWLRLLSSRDTRIDVASPTPRALRHTVERGAPLAAMVVGIAAFAANATPVWILASMCAGAIAFGAKGACSMVALHFSRAHLEALGRGITYKDARAFERAAGANVAVLSARGTVLMGEPEIVAIEPVGAFDGGRVLSLAAGAEAGFAHPFAAAVLRAARRRRVVPDHVRNPTAHAGLGVTAVASTGERLVVGGRALMLKEKIGVAGTDPSVSELEAQGRSVLLVALDDRLVGIIALQDGLRPGARAAVQNLLDARIEPVLLSGEARDTCETIGHALDIEHVRPEVLPADRAVEIRALAEGGNVVAVIGHTAEDDGALAAADVAVAMGTAGATSGEWAVVLASDDVRDAALALAIPHAARDRARIAIAVGATPGLLALLAIGFGVGSIVVAPVAALIGAVAVAAHARESAAA
jgi:Cu+-exporting ATPase